MKTKRKKLGQMLLGAGKISETQLLRGLDRQRALGGRLGTNLVLTGAIRDDELLTFLSLQTGLPTINLAEIAVAEDIIKKIPQRMAEQYLLIPIRLEEPNTLVVAFADPTDKLAKDQVERHTGHDVTPILTTCKCIIEGIHRFYFGNTLLWDSDEPEIEDTTLPGLMVPAEEVDLVAASANLRLDALVRVLVRKGLVDAGELAEEVLRLQQQTG